jgi:hypothetical protein
MGWAKFWATFLQAHLVALMQKYQPAGKSVYAHCEKDDGWREKKNFF